jgi:hypothetical protein
MALTEQQESSTAASPVDSGRPANDTPALSVPELAGSVIRRVMRKIEENPDEDPIALLARELEDIERS